jgi:hypothetical protein
MSLLYLISKAGIRIPNGLGLILALMGTPALVEGQTDLQVMDIPQKFVIPSDESDLEDDKLYFEGYPWIVYSDREYNKSYTQPGGSIAMKYLDKFSAYAVVGWKKEYLHIAKKIPYGNAASYKLEDYGWVEMSKLLLWNHCLVNPDNYCNKKAIVIYSENTRYIYEQSGYIEDAKLKFTIFFIYKSLGEYYLIGTSPGLPKTSENVSGLLKLIPKEFVWVWDGIEALEPNCKFEQQLPDGRNILHSVIFKTENSVNKYIKNSKYKPIDIYWSNDTCKDHMPAWWLRFPVLAEKDSIITVGLFPEYTGIPCEDEVSMIPGYCTNEPDSPNPMFTRVILTSKEELGKIISIYNMFLGKVSPTSSFMEVVETWISILKEERYDQREREHGLLTFNDINRMLFSYDHSNDISGGLPIAVFASASSYISFNYEDYYNRLIENLSQLEEILNQKDIGDGFYSNGILYYWLPASLLP